jgi:hypothetical protein
MPPDTLSVALLSASAGRRVRTGTPSASAPVPALRPRLRSLRVSAKARSSWRLRRSRCARALRERLATIPFVGRKSTPVAAREVADAHLLKMESRGVADGLSTVQQGGFEYRPCGARRERPTCRALRPGFWRAYPGGSGQRTSDDPGRRASMSPVAPLGCEPGYPCLAERFQRYHGQQRDLTRRITEVPLAERIGRCSRGLTEARPQTGARVATSESTRRAWLHWRAASRTAPRGPAGKR